MALLIVTPGIRAEGRLDDEKRLPKQQAGARIWSLSNEPALAMGIKAGAEPCDAFLGEVRMSDGSSGGVVASVCFGPDKPTGDVELVSGVGEALSLHHLVFTFDPSTRTAGYSLKRVLGRGSFVNQFFVSKVATAK